MSDAILLHTTHTKEGAPAKKASGAYHSPKKDVSDIFTWVYTLLVDSVQTQFEGVQIKAKQLAVNGYDQQKMIDRLNQVKWTNVPTPEKVQHTIRDTHRHKFINENGEISFFDTYTYRHIEVTVNQNAISEANITNSQRNKMRQDIEGGLSILQQTAQTSEAEVNTDINQSMTTTQETSALLDMLKSLTNRILIRQHSS